MTESEGMQHGEDIGKGKGIYENTSDKIRSNRI